MTKLMKRILSLAAVVTVLCALAIPASAHGGGHGGRHGGGHGGRHGGRATAPATVYCDYCDQYHASGAHHNGGHHGGYCR